MRRIVVNFVLNCGFQRINSFIVVGMSFNCEADLFFPLYKFTN